MSMSTESEIAWAAGLFEGEGCFAYTPNHVRAELAMTDHDTVRRFQSVVGVGGFYHKKTYADHHKPQLVWRITDRAGVQTVLEMFRPWLSDRRCRRGEEILRLQAERSKEVQAKRDACCKRGHPRTPENTYVYRLRDKDARACKVCRAEANRRQRQLARSLAEAVEDDE